MCRSYGTYRKPDFGKRGFTLNEQPFEESHTVCIGTEWVIYQIRHLLEEIRGPPTETSDQTDGDTPAGSTGETAETATELTALEIVRSDDEVLIEADTGEPLFPVRTRDALSGEPSTKIGGYASEHE